MYTEFKNDQGEINSTLFIHYNGVGLDQFGIKSKSNEKTTVRQWDEYVLTWNDEFRMDQPDKEDKEN